MSRHTLAVFLVLAIAQLFVIHQGEATDVNIGEPCTATDDCVSGADPCDVAQTQICTCSTGTFTKADKSGCVTLAKIGEACPSSAVCVAGAGPCDPTKSEKCACPATEKANAGNTGCVPNTGTTAVLKKIEETCTPTEGCVQGAAPCDGSKSEKCKCPATAKPKIDKSGCDPLTKIGSKCTTELPCVPDAESCDATKTETCKCAAGKMTKKDMTGCENGATAVVTSLGRVLLDVTSDVIRRMISASRGASL